MEEILKKRDQILKKFNLMYNGLVKEYLAIKGERDDETSKLVDWYFNNSTI